MLKLQGAFAENFRCRRHRTPSLSEEGRLSTWPREKVRPLLGRYYSDAEGCICLLQWVRKFVARDAISLQLLIENEMSGPFQRAEFNEFK